MTWQSGPQCAARLFIVATSVAIIGALAHPSVGWAEDDVKPGDPPGRLVMPIQRELPEQQVRPAPAVGQDGSAIPKFADNVRVRIADKSLPLTDVVRQAATNRQLAQYRELRMTHSATAEGQLQLAKWCRQQGLAEEERLHWWSLLAFQPTNSEAIKSLRLRKYRGMLLTSDELQQVKQEQKKAKQAAGEWMPKLKKIKQAIEHGDAAERNAAFGELQSIRDPRALPSIAKVFSIDDSSIALRLVESIAKMPEDEAAESLVRLAVQAPDAYVRERAATALQSYPEHTYVPMLVAGLAAPIEMSSRVAADPGRPVYEWYEGQQFTGRLVVGMYDKIRLRSSYVPSDVLFWTFETRRVAGWTMTGQTPDRLRYDFQLSRDSPDPDAPYEYLGAIDGLNHAGTRNRGAKDFRNSVADLQKEVKEANERTALLNQRIHAALTKATGVQVVPGDPDADPKDVDVNPRLWWDWWRKELHLNSYFAQGTEVWTQRGPVLIEEILVGDRMLTRNPKTRELMFSLVVQCDVQAEGVVHAIDVDSRTIVATPEQRFFVTGDGWRKASELKPGMQLDSLDGPRRIEKIASGEALSRYGLVIADTPNFFVDRLGILVHDATRR